MNPAEMAAVPVYLDHDRLNWFIDQIEYSNMYDYFTTC